MRRPRLQPRVLVLALRVQRRLHLVAAALRVGRRHGRPRGARDDALPEDCGRHARGGDPAPAEAVMNFVKHSPRALRRFVEIRTKAT